MIDDPSDDAHARGNSAAARHDMKRWNLLYIVVAWVVCSSSSSNSAFQLAHGFSRWEFGTSRRDWLNGVAAALLTSNSLLTPPLPGNAAEVSYGKRPRLSDDFYNLSPVATRPEAGQFYFPALTPPFQHRAGRGKRGVFHYLRNSSVDAENVLFRAKPHWH